MNPMDAVNQTLDELNENYACKCGPIQAIEVPGDMSAAIYDRKTKLGIIVIGKDAVCDDPLLMRFITIHEYAHIGTMELSDKWWERLSLLLTTGHNRAWRENERLILADYGMEVDFLPFVTYERMLRVNGVPLGNPFAINPALTRKFKRYRALNLGVVAMLMAAIGTSLFMPEYEWIGNIVAYSFIAIGILMMLGGQFRNRRILKHVRSMGFKV